jgi:hypothetical protein
VGGGETYEQMDGGEEDILGVHLVEPGLVGELGDRCPGGREREMGSGCGQFLPFRCLKRSDSSEGRRPGGRKGTVGEGELRKMLKLQRA